MNVAAGRIAWYNRAATISGPLRRFLESEGWITAYRFAPEQRLDLRKAADLGKDLHALRTQLRRNRIHDWIADARHEGDEALGGWNPLICIIRLPGSM